MSIVSVNQLGGGFVGEKTGTGRRYEAQYRVATDDLTNDQDDVLAAAGVPDLYDTHSKRGTMQVTSVKARKDSQAPDDLYWIVDVTYETRKGESEDPVAKPTDLPPVIAFDDAGFQRVVDKAYQAGDTQDSPTGPVENSAEDPFDPPLTVEDGHTVIRIDRNETVSFFSPTRIMDYKRTINRNAITIAGLSLLPAEALLVNITARKAWDQDNDPYYAVSYTIAVDYRLHVAELLDQGFYYLDTGEKKHFLDKDLEPITKPQKLDGAGADLGAGTPVYIAYQQFWDADWSVFDFPTST